jgi:hypothetical protein
MKKIFICFLLVINSFNANAVVISHSSSSNIINSEEFFNVINSNLNNPAIQDAGRKYRIYAKISSKINEDGSVIYLFKLIFQKEIKDVRSGDLFWVMDRFDSDNYGVVSTKQQLLERIKRTVIDDVNQWRP